MKKCLKFSLLVIFALFISTNSHSQVNPHLIIPPTSQYAIVDMWNLTLTSLFDKPQYIYLVGEVKVDGEEIFTGISNEFKIPANYSGRLDYRTLEPVDGKYEDSDLEEIIVRTGYFPDKDLTICIFVRDVNTGAQLGMTCIVHIVANREAPNLFYPGDGDILSVLPILSFTPASPMDVNVKYKVELWEMYDGQGHFEASEANFPYYTDKGFHATSYQFPVSARITPGQYAWRISAAYGNSKKYDLGSEVFRFTYETELFSEPVENADIINQNTLVETKMTKDLFTQIYNSDKFLQALQIIDSSCQYLDTTNATVYSLKGDPTKWETQFVIRPDNMQDSIELGQLIVIQNEPDSLLVAFEDNNSGNPNDSIYCRWGYGPWFNRAAAYCARRWICFSNNNEGMWVKQKRCKINNPSRCQYRTHFLSCGCDDPGYWGEWLTYDFACKQKFLCFFSGQKAKYKKQKRTWSAPPYTEDFREVFKHCGCKPRPSDVIEVSNDSK